MSIVTYIVDTAETFLDDAAQTQFGSVATTVGTMIQLACTVLVIFVFINMAYQYRSMDGRQAFWLAVKIILVGIFATNWTQFNSLSSAILSGIDSISAALVASVGGGTPGPSGTFAEQFDSLIASLGDYLNAAGSELNWMAGALMDLLGVVLLSLLGGLAAFIIVASRLMIALLLGLAPIMIFLTLFEVTKDYFARWLSAVISFALYPVVVAGVFATIVGIARSLLTRLGDPADATNIGALLPFFMMVLMAKGFIIATPFIVRAISGNIVMPALTSGLGGSYAFGRAFGGSQQAQNRYLMGSATGSEYAGLRLRSMVTRQPMPERTSYGQPSPAANSSQPAPPPRTGTGQQMIETKARSQRIADAGKK
ncbi:type IV secretion system protein [Jannaschia marina]|uniref:type IV secretion system protein n=1 Tax=Jannaschia marina TaxID=2741674 RepID=UPI0015C7CB09|nr:type IV secretion system protein [Jannaschia marina]